MVISKHARMLAAVMPPSSFIRILIQRLRKAIAIILLISYQWAIVIVGIGDIDWGRVTAKMAGWYDRPKSEATLRGELTS